MSEQRVPDFINDSHQLSSEEFCRQLSVWFEDRGLISDLRAHLRSQMIKALRGTSIGAKPSKKTATPKFQAINMLIAEYLLQQEHHYTLSVFTSEVPLQEFAGTPVGNLSRGSIIKNDDGPPRFHRRDIWDILETLGLSPDSEESNRVYNMYQENQREALLTCVFRILPALSKNQSKRDQSCQAALNINESIDVTSKETARHTSNAEPHHTGPNQEMTVKTLNEEIANILNQSNLKRDKRRNLQEKIKQLIKLEGTRAMQEADQKYDRELVERERKIQASLIQRDNLLKRCVSQSELKILQEKKDIEKGKQEMANVAGQLRESHVHITRSFNELEERQEMLRAREVEMERLRQLETARFIEQASDLDIHKRKLDQEFERLEKERMETEQLRNGLHDLKRNLDDANHALSESQSQLAIMDNLQHQCEYLRRELHSAKHYLKQLSSEKKRQNSAKQVDKHQQTDKTDDSRLKVDSSKYNLNASEMCQQLQQENAELRARSHHQEMRIWELTTRASHLAMEVEAAQNAHDPAGELHSAASFVASESGTVLPAVTLADASPPPPPPPLPPRNVTPVPSYRGGGEDLVGHVSVLQTVTPQQTQRPIEARETRRKPPRRLVIHNPTSSEESSPTDEVLQEARRRLRTLEEESAEVDRRFQDFKRRQATFFDTAASVLHPSGQSAPLYNHRLSDPPNHHPRRHYAPSVLPTFYGASSSGLSQSRHIDDMLTKPSATHVSHTTSSSRVSQFRFNNLSNNNASPYFDRITDIFQSSLSSDSDSSLHPFSFLTPNTSSLKVSSSVTRQTQTLETNYERISNRNSRLQDNTKYPSSPYPRKGGVVNSTDRPTTEETNISLAAKSAYSTGTKQQSKKVQFVQHSDVAESTPQAKQYHKPSLSNLNLTKAVVQAELTNSLLKDMQEEDNMTSAIECDEAVLSCPPTESNYVERYELQQLLLASESSDEPEDQDQNAPSVGKQQMTTPENILPDAQLGLKRPTTMPHTSRPDGIEIVHPSGVITSLADDHNESPSQEGTDDRLETLLPQKENEANTEVASMPLLEDNKLEISDISYALNQLDINKGSALPSSATQDCNRDSAIPQGEPDIVNLDELLGLQETDMEKISALAQSGSGSGFASSVGKMSVSSIAMSSDTQLSNAASDEAQETSTESSDAQSSGTESVQAPPSIPITTIAQQSSVKVNDDAHVIDAHSSDGMSAPDDKGQSDEDFWA